MKSECIDYRELPDQNPLFLDYLYDFGKVAEFYHPLPASPDAWKSRARSVLERERFPRQQLSALLEDYNRRLGASQATLDNLALLADPETVAVVTGQQVGLLGGPCYTAYKAATAVELARRLRTWGIAAVPVFWLAADDSDFDEVRTTHFVDGDGGLFSVSHPDVRSDEQQMAGTARIDDWESWLAPVRTSLESGLPSARIRDSMLEDYAPRRTFREAFVRWISRVFREQGLVFFDPLIEGYRGGLSGLFETVISRREELVEVSLERRRRLRAAGFEPQVMVDEAETFLFWLEGEGRYKLEAADGAFRVRDRSRDRYSAETLLQGLASGKVRLAPNVLLRPIVQDYLFPTVTSVLGPAEIAYYAQVNAIAPYFGQEPMACPRSAFTIVDRKSRRLLDKYEIPASRVLQMEPRDLAELLLRGSGEQPALDKLEALRACVEQNVRVLFESSLGAGLEAPELEMTKKAESKILYQIEKVKRRLVANRAERDAVVRRHLDHLSHHLAPARKLQERCLNFNYFLNEGGPDFIERLIGAVESECSAHKILYL